MSLNVKTNLRLRGSRESILFSDGIINISHPNMIKRPTSMIVLANAWKIIDIFYINFTYMSIPLKLKDYLWLPIFDPFLK
jgi:hypothetical protein